MRKSIAIIFLCLLTSLAARGDISVSQNIADLYDHFHFDPSATNCGTLVQISDIHMNVNADQLATHEVVTNLDPRLVTMIKAISPKPTAMILTGDLSVAGAFAFGVRPFLPDATNELIYAREALKVFTDWPLYLVPGNHDNAAIEVTNAPLFNSVFTNISRFTNFTVAGMPVLALDGHGGGWLDPEEQAWMAGFRQKLDHSKPVIVAIHQPVLPARGTDARESGRDLIWFFKPWTAPVYVMSGHAHFSFVYRNNYGMTTVTQYVCPAAQNGLAPTSNPLLPTACGFYVWCITNGTLAGVVRGVLTNQTYYALGLDYDNTGLSQPYDGYTNVLFRAEEGHFNRSDYGVTVQGGQDVTYWRSYLTTYTCRLPIEKYTNATRALLITETTNDTVFYLGTSTNSWTAVPIESWNDDIASVPIPENLRSGPLWFMGSNSIDQFFVGGFALATSNTVSDFQGWAGLAVGDSTIAPDTFLPEAGGIDAWDAYLFGLDAVHGETMAEIEHNPQIGGRPFLASGLMRFPGRASIPYSVWQSASVAGPWTAADAAVTATTNGWNEYVVTNSAPSSFFRISSPAQ